MSSGFVTLIPAYKEIFFDETLSCLEHQSTKPDLIVISDDSPSQLFLTRFQNGDFKSRFPSLNLFVTPGPRLGSSANSYRLIKLGLELVGFEFFHILLDDDVIYPDFYASHAAALTSSSTECSVSRRWILDVNGMPIGAPAFPINVFDKRLFRLDIQMLYSSIVPPVNNWVGEFSNMVLRRNALQFLADTEIGGLFHIGLWDVGVILGSAEKSDVVLISDFLGGFRQNVNSTSQNKQSELFHLAILGWLPFAIRGFRLGLVSSDDFKRCLQNLLQFEEVLFASHELKTKLAQTVQQLAGNSSTDTEMVAEFWRASLSNFDEVKRFLLFKESLSNIERSK
jgi:hypothetical protein